QVGKEYRLPTELECERARAASERLGAMFAELPFGLPKEKICTDAKGNTWCVLFGVDEFGKLFSERQLLALGVFLKFCRSAAASEWTTPIRCYLACVFSKMLDYENISTSWYSQNEQISHLFKRFALPILWDYSEASPIGGASGSWGSMLNSVCKSIDTAVALP